MSTRIDPTKIELILSSETHARWKHAVKAAALSNGAWGILKGSSVIPHAAPTTEEHRKENREWEKRREGVSGVIYATLDEAHQGIVADIDPEDAKALWDKLNAQYERKDIGGRFFAMQNLMAITYKDSDHPSESLSEFGNRVVDAAKKFRDLMPDEPALVQATTTAATATCRDEGTHRVTITQGTLTPATLSAGFTATMLVDELTINVIIIGLGRSEESQRLKHTLIQTGIKSLTDLLSALQKEDSLNKSEDFSPTGNALAATTTAPRRKDKGKYFCKKHGENKSHNTRDCKALKTENANVGEGGQAALVAGVNKIASPPIRRSPSESANTFWNVDSGATSHMTPHKEWIRNMKPCRIPIRLANHNVVFATGKGNVVFTPTRNMCSIMFSNVLYVPELQNNLFSIVAAVVESKLRVEIENSELVFKDKGEVILTGSIKGKVAMLDGQTVEAIEAQAFLTSVSKDLLHQRLGHIGKARLEQMLKQNLVKGISIEGGAEIKDICEHCIAGKQHRDPFPKLSENRATEILVRIHTDVHGPLKRATSAAEYWITLVDDASRKKEVVPMTRKSDSAEIIENYIKRIQRQTGKKVKMVRDDKGGEYMSKKLQKFFESEGIIREQTVRATPSQNGVAERLNRTLAEGIVAMLNQANLPQNFWAFAVVYLAKILDVTPSSALSDTTSYEVWTGTKPDLTMFRTFGCRMFVNVLKKDRKNLESHTRPCIFIGFHEGMKGWKFYDPVTKKTGVSRDAIFDETSFPGLSTKGNVVTPEKSELITFWIDTKPDDEEASPTPSLPPPPPPASPALSLPTPLPPAPPAPSPTPPPREQTPPQSPPPSTAPFSPATPARLAPSSAPVPFPQQSPSRPSSSTAPQESPRDRKVASTMDFSAAVKKKGTKASFTVPPPASARPIRATEVHGDYKEGVRRGTQPAPRRETLQIVNRGGTQDDNERPLPGTFPSLPTLPSSDEEEPTSADEENVVDTLLQTEEEADLDAALKATPIVDSLEFVYSLSDAFVPWLTAQQIGMEIAIERANSAATRPEDSPRNWTEAMSRSDADKWLEAAETEVEALRRNGTWELVELPPGRKPIGSRWVFLIKRKSDGTIDRYKARLVAKGYAQAPGIDFDQVFAPTARLAALRAILAQAALNGEHIESLDISNAYLNGELEEEYEVYMNQPEGFTKKGPNNERWVCKLKKGLYGLKQAGRLWYQKLGETLEQIGFKQINADPSVYVWMLKDVRVILPVFVDDVTITSKSTEKTNWVKEELAKHFKVRDLGPTSYLLGIKVEYDKSQHRLQLSQTQYIIDMLNRFGMTDCSGVTTPMDPGAQLSKEQSPKSDEEKEYMTKVPYINAVGALMYLAVATRPDIVYTVAKLAQFNSYPGEAHWKAVKHLLRYLQETKDLKLTYQPSTDGKDTLSTEIFRAYSDADHAGCLDTRRSTTGYFLKMGTGAISWSSKKQASVSFSSTEAEYIAAATAGVEVIWMRELLKELGFKINSASPLYMDNKSALAVVKNPKHHGCMKHVDIRYHWIRQEVKRKNISVHFLPTEQMTADILTKPLARLWPMAVPDQTESFFTSSPAVLMWRGRRALTSGDLAMAFVCFTEAHQIYTRIDDQTGRASAVLVLADVHRLRNEYSEAIALYSEALQIHTDNRNRQGRADALWGLAAVRWAQNGYREAIALYSKTFQLHLDNGNRQSRADTLWGLASVQRMRKEYSEAIALYSEVLQIRTDIGDWQGRAPALWGLAEVHSLRDESSEAIALYSQSLQICIDIDDKQGRASALKGLADIHHHEGRHDDATSLYEQAAEIYEQCGNGDAAAYAFKKAADIRQGLEFVEVSPG
ncbi:hypothetical protein FRC05_007218 [Tulasnella sp. 425]|nr:hypothetical protein FRC05_007218 [Tulasnella sp. 425]